VIRRFRLVLPCLAALLTGCAFGPDSSYVAPLAQPADAQVLANGISAFVATRLPAASSTVALEPPPSDQADNSLTPALASALRHRGFAVAEGGQTLPPGAHHLRYLVTSLGEGNLVRLTLDGTSQGSRFFVRNSAGGLQSGGPFTVTQAEAER